MKNTFTKLLSLVLALVLCLGMFAACGNDNKTTDPTETDEPDDLLGITDDTIWVGNTAGTTGALASVGAPFNLGIQAAFDAYNKAGGYNGKSIKLKHYDDGGLAENSTTLLEKLIHEDEVFAIVGHFGSYAVDVTLETLIDEEVPMIYAAAGNEELLNENASTLGEKGIVPIQPLNKTEGRMLILRAFAPTDKGGLAATKVGVIANSNEASQSLLAGIKDEMNNLPADKKNNVIIQEVNSTDYSAAVNALKAAGCDVVLLTVIGGDYLTALTTMANVDYKCNVLTSYNNASAATFNAGNVLQEQYYDIFTTMNIFAQAWLDISSAEYVYKDESSPLYQMYAAFGLHNGGAGVAGYTEEYWVVANNIYNYATSIKDPTAFAMSYDAYALAGYIAGDLFCQAMEELEASGKALSRKNLISVLESKEYKIAMADALSFANGMRSGVQSFALTWVFDSHNLEEGATVQHAATSITVHGLMSIEDYRALLQE
ncbi:MAG: ABC transporter substrate-binding protein [Clostridia bacterium]|nr:ABC transporter substrate-binding protein [Clostridia bacterium]